MLAFLFLVRSKSFLGRIRTATLCAKLEFDTERALTVECISLLLWVPRLTLLFASLKHDKRCCLPLILTCMVSDLVTVILLCFQVTNYVDTASENEGPEETINDAISEKSNITQNDLKLVSSLGKLPFLLWDSSSGLNLLHYNVFL